VTSSRTWYALVSAVQPPVVKEVCQICSDEIVPNQPNFDVECWFHSARYATACIEMNCGREARYGTWGFCSTLVAEEFRAVGVL
jgi:hypothetical protein